MSQGGDGAKIKVPKRALVPPKTTPTPKDNLPRKQSAPPRLPGSGRPVAVPKMPPAAALQSKRNAVDKSASETTSQQVAATNPLKRGGGIKVPTKAPSVVRVPVPTSPASTAPRREASSASLKRSVSKSSIRRKHQESSSSSASSSEGVESTPQKRSTSKKTSSQIPQFPSDFTPNATAASASSGRHSSSSSSQKDIHKMIAAEVAPLREEIRSLRSLLNDTLQSSSGRTSPPLHQTQHGSFYLGGLSTPAASTATSPRHVDPASMPSFSPHGNSGVDYSYASPPPPAFYNNELGYNPPYSDPLGQYASPSMVGGGGGYAPLYHHANPNAIGPYSTLMRRNAAGSASGGDVVHQAATRRLHLRMLQLLEEERRSIHNMLGLL